MEYSGKVQKREVAETRAWAIGDKKYTGAFRLTDQRPVFQSQSQLVQLAKGDSKQMLIKRCLQEGCGYLYDSIQKEVENIFQTEEGRVILSWDEEHILSLPWRTDALEILRYPQKYADRSFPTPKPPMVMDAAGQTVTFPMASPAEITKTFICPEHLGHITEVCKSSGYIIVVREAGALSLKRMREGAAPKPHTVLAKSVSRNRVKEMMKSDGWKKKVKTDDEKTLLDKYGGFVGKWEEGVLEGLILVKSKKSELMKLKSDSGEPLFSWDPKKQPDFLSLEQVDILKENKRDWQSFFYTGDYDLHEVYDNRNFQIPEATLEKRRLLNKLNAGLVPDYIPVDTNPLDATLPLRPIHVPDSRAPFQHGDQATYRMNQVLEGKRLKSPRIELVRPVAIADTGRLAWCVRGTWYITEGLEEQKELRRELKLTAPSTWEEDELEKSSKTKGYYRGGEHTDGKRTQMFG